MPIRSALREVSLPFAQPSSREETNEEQVPAKRRPACMFGPSYIGKTTAVWQAVIPLDCSLNGEGAQHLANYLDACRLYMECLDVAYVADYEGSRDRLLRAPVTREGE